MGRETELKLRCENREQLNAVRQLPEIRDCTAGMPEEIRMKTVYFDTPDGALGRLRRTMRLRRENDVSLFYLKTPAGKDGALSERGEWCTEVAEFPACVEALIAEGAPEDLRELCRNGIVPVCGAEFTRIAMPLRLADGSTCELALDEGVLTKGEKRLPFLETELELKSGSAEEMTVLGRALVDKLRLIPEPKSKFRRAAEL